MKVLVKVRVFTLQKRREPSENCAFLGYYAASSSNFLPTFRYISVSSSRVFLENGSDMSSRIFGKSPGFLTHEDGTGSLARSVGKELPLLAV